MGKGNKIFGIPQGLAIVGVILIVAGFMSGVLSTNAPYVDWSKLGGSQTASVANPNPAAAAVSAGQCVYPSGGNTATLGVLVRNTQNSTYQQLASTTWLTDLNGVTKSSVATTDAAAKAFASMTPVPCVDGYLYVLGDGSTNSEKVKADSLIPNQNKEIDGTQNTRLTFSLYTNTLQADNSSVGPSSAQGSVDINSTTHAISSGGSFTGYIDGDFQSASSAFGSRDGGVVIGADHNLAVYSRENGVKLSSLTGLAVSPISCPDDMSRYLNVDTCWKLDQVSSRATATPMRFTYTLKADLGEPGASDDVNFYFVDNQYFLDTDGTIKMGAFNNGGTDQGVANGKVSIDVS